MKLAAIVLAAGSARRFGGDKLTARFAGEPLLHHAIRAARAAPVERVVVVCPPGLALPVGDELSPVEAPPVEAVRIASAGLAESLRAGIGAVAEMDGAFVFLGDMPLVPLGLARELALLLGDHFAVVPRHDGRPGHPVLLARAAFADVTALEGDTGAGALLKARDDVRWFEVDEPGTLLDVDHPEDLARLCERQRNPH